MHKKVALGKRELKHLLNHINSYVLVSIKNTGVNDQYPDIITDKDGNLFLLYTKSLINLHQTYQYQNLEELDAIASQQLNDPLFEIIHKIVKSDSKTADKIFSQNAVEFYIRQSSESKLNWLVFSYTTFLGFISCTNFTKTTYSVELFIYPKKLTRKNKSHIRTIYLLTNKLTIVLFREQDPLKLYDNQKSYLVNAIQMYPNLTKFNEIINLLFHIFRSEHKRYKLSVHQCRQILRALAECVQEKLVKAPYLKNAVEVKFVTDIINKHHSRQINTNYIVIICKNKYNKYGFRYINFTKTQPNVISSPYIYNKRSEFIEFKRNCERLQPWLNTTNS
jgi:hypothetical protein